METILMVILSLAILFLVTRSGYQHRPNDQFYLDDEDYVDDGRPHIIVLEDLPDWYWDKNRKNQ